MTNWANRGKAAIAAVPLNKNGTNRGERFEGGITEAVAKTYSTGSTGITIGYSIPGNKFPIRENVVLTDKAGVATKYGMSTLIKRLQAAGNSAERINQFALSTDDAKNALTLADYLVGAAVAVYLVDAEYLGKPKKEVKAVFPLDGNGPKAA